MSDLICSECKLPMYFAQTNAPVMPYSPLDALIDALPAVRKAGRVAKDDDVLSVQKRIADVFLPIVERIQREARNAALERAAEIARETCPQRTLSQDLQPCRDCRRLAAAIEREKSLPR